MLIDRARALTAELAAARTRNPTATQLEADIVDRLRRDQLFGALLPHELGGQAMAPVDYIAMLEALALGDPATAWCVMTASTSTLVAAYLPEPTARAIWQPGAPPPMLAGVFAPMGRLTVGADGPRLAGKWSWASGCAHAEWFLVGALADAAHVVGVVPKRDVTIIDNWDPLGLAATGSHDIAIDTRIDLNYVTSVFDRAPWTRAPLYRVPMFGLLAAGIAGCALGIARRALDGLRVDPAAPSHWLARYAEARATIDSAHAYLTTTLRAGFAAAEHDRVTASDRGALRLAAAHTTTACSEAVRILFHLGGGSSVRAGSAVGAALRDLETIRTHRMISAAGLPAFARALLGLGTPPADL